MGQTHASGSQASAWNETYLQPIIKTNDTSRDERAQGGASLDSEICCVAVVFCALCFLIFFVLFLTIHFSKKIFLTKIIESLKIQFRKFKSVPYHTFFMYKQHWMIKWGTSVRVALRVHLLMYHQEQPSQISRGD